MVKRGHWNQRPEARSRQAQNQERPAGLERLYTIAQIAQLGGPCRAKLYLDIKAGRLKARKFGRSTRITEGAYRDYINAAPSL
jgi:hypothetical protein